MISIRPAEATDIPALRALDSTLPETPSRADEIADWVAAGWCFCAIGADGPAGYGVVHHYFFGRPMLEMLMIAADQRHQGIGGALLDHAIARYARPTLWTSTNQSNAPMQALLLARGFQPSGQIEGLDEGDPELFFRISRV